MEISFKQYLEAYNNNLIYLRQYMRDRPFHISDYYHEFIHWQGSPPILKRARVTSKQLESWWDNGEDKFYQACDRIKQAMTDEEQQAFIDYLLTKHSAEAPTWAYMDYTALLPPQTWLIHFSDNSEEIWTHGFKYGVDDMSKLGLTNWLHKNVKKYGGYNFAFTANSRNAANAAHSHKYGQHAVVFQTAGIEAYHYGDTENQIIFYGPEVPPNKLILLRRNYDDWCIATNGKISRECAFTGEFNKAITWIMNHHQQYARHIYGG